MIDRFSGSAFLRTFAIGICSILFSSLLPAQSYTSYYTGNPADVIRTPAGGVCMMGGASESDDAMRWFLQRANGGDVLVLRASGSNGYNNYMFSQLGVTVNSVESIVFNNASAANEAYIHQKINRAEAIWFAGGDQWNYISYWRNTPISNLINQAIQNRNIVIGGTSAGMAILGGFYFSAQNGTVTSAEALSNPYHVRMTIDSARFLQNQMLRDVITDTHYDNPNRKGRHVGFLARIFTDWGIEARGIACDEYTAVCVDPSGNAVVYGGFPAFDDNAYFIQTNCEIPVASPEHCAPGNPLHWNRDSQALRVYKVKGTPAGSNRFNLSDWKTGSGGVWENWYVNNGVLFEIAGVPVNCQLTSTTNATEQGSNLMLYPNPGSDALNIALPREILFIEIIDLNGKVHTRLETTPAAGISVDTSGIPAGLYFIRVKSSNRNYIQKWIKR